jgi:hypothetical protein
VPAHHPDDELHPPTSDAPYGTATCRLTVTVPKWRPSGQYDPCFETNLRVLSAGAFHSHRHLDRGHGAADTTRKVPAP